MNTKTIYAAAGGIAAVAIAIFFVVGPANFKLPSLGQNTVTQLEAVEITIKNVTVSKIDDMNARVNVALGAHNPNSGTAILETVSYNVYVDNFRMVSGDIGRSPEGFVTSQEGVFTIISNSTITLRDSQVSVRDNLIGTSWDNMVAGNARYTINGTYSYRMTVGLQTAGAEKDFSLTFP